MENHIQSIELINRYLDKTLADEEIQDFENRLRTEIDFKSLYNEHLLFLEGLKRRKLKEEIKKAKQSYIRNKWFKYLGFAFAIVTVLTLIYFSVFNSDKAYLKSKLNFESEYIQSFRVAVDSVIEVIGEKGTKIRFNPEDLQTILNKPFDGDSLNIELIELINKQDLLLANAQTISNNKWLVSGGAFKIDVKYKGEFLVLKEGKTVEAQFPKNTSEGGGMQIFYGGRDEENNMNWEASEVKLEPFPFVIIIGNSILSLIDEELTKLYGVDTCKELSIIDSLGRLDIEKNFSKVNYYDKRADTIRIYKQKVLLEEKSNSIDEEYYRIIEVDSLAWLKNKREITIDSILIDLEDFWYSERYNIASASVYEQISKLELSEMKDAISKENYNELKREEYSLKEENKKIYKTLDKIYQTVQLSKLGWINIDKFARDEEKATIKLNFNINTNHNETYIVDQKNNTVLNVYEDNIDLPINRSFYVIAIGIKGKDIYGFKKSVRFSKSSDFKIDFKKINESQIKSILTLEKSIDIPDSLSGNTNKQINLDSISNQNVEQFEERKVYNQVVTKPKEEEGVYKYSKNSQIFKINAKKDITINCKEGTKLIIKANSFVDSDHKVVAGEIDFKIKEYYKVSDMLLANLTTQSDGKQLETGGMLYIEAFRGDELLKLNSSIGISFPTENKKEGMRLFTGKREGENINWILQEKQKPEIDDLLDEVIEVTEDDSSEDVEVPFSVVEQVPIYPGCEERDNEKQRKCTSDAINKFVQRKFNTAIAEEVGFNGRVRINVIFRINKNGDVVSIQSRANHPRLEEEVKRVLALIPKMRPGKQRGFAVTVPYSLPIIFQTDGESAFIGSNGSVPRVSKIQDSIANKRFEDRLTLKDSINVSVSEVNNYILRTSKLGWVNCDRFIRNRSRIQYKLKIKDSKGAIVSMVFKNVNSVMPSWKNNEEYDFRIVPKGEDVVLVAIKRNEGKLFFDIIETKTQENPILDFNFKEITLTELKIQLKKLNRTF